MTDEIHRITPKKSLGQHFLNNERVPAKMATAGDVRASDLVLEIGPGTGVLTRELLLRGATVYAVETDSRAVSLLKERFQSEIMAQKLVIIQKDVRSLSLSDLGLLPHQYKVIANIPYYLSGFLFRLFLEHEIQPSILVFLVQKEVAVRVARDTKESILSLSVKAFGNPRYEGTVGKGNFSPAPQVDSAIVSILTTGTSALHGVPKEFFFRVLHAGMGTKRKQLIHNLTPFALREELNELFTFLKLPLTVRGEDVPLDTWVRIASHLHETESLG